MSKRFTFVCGDDDFLVTDYGRKRFNELTDGLMDDLSKEIVDGNAGKAEEAVQAISNFIAAAQTLSLFGEKKTVWLKDISFLADNRTASAEDTLEALERLQTFLESVDPESVHLLLTASPVDKRRKFFKWLSKNSDFKEIKGGNAKDLGLYIQKELRPLGAEISTDALNFLIEKTSGNTRLAITEALKLATYIGPEGGGRIEEDDVREMVPDPVDGDFFETTDVFFTGDLQGTLDALGRYFFINKEARPLLASLQSRNRLLIQLRTLTSSGEVSVGYRGLDGLDRAAEKYLVHYGGSKEKNPLNIFSQNAWYLGKVAQSAKGLSLKKLVDFQLTFVEAFQELVSRPREQEEVMRAMAIRCLG